MATFNRPTDMPVDQVRILKQRGLDNNQIVAQLQRSGYTATQISDAITQSELTSGGPIYQDQQAMGLPPQPGQGGFQQPPAQDAGGEPGDEQIEEMIETIVEEKWHAVSGDISKISEWKGDVETKLTKMEQRIDELRANFDKLHQAIIGKIGDYDKNILAVGAEIKAMERVFSKVLPMFTENVNELNRITRTLSQAGPKESSRK